MPGALDPKSVFLNVPFDKQYERLFVTLVGTVVLLGQTPHCVLEVRERGQGRLARIFDLLRSCGASIHDLSRVGVPARFDVPFELGLACSLALAGEPHDVLVLDAKPYRLDRTLSDYKGRDPLIHHGRPRTARRLPFGRLSDRSRAEAPRFSSPKLGSCASLPARSPHGVAAPYPASRLRALVAAATERARRQGVDRTVARGVARSPRCRPERRR